MHEVGITRNIVGIAEEHACSQGATRVLSVSVEIGELSGVVPESVEFCFEACSVGTLLEGALLIVHRVAGEGQCEQCGEKLPMDNYTFTCTTCGGFSLKIVRGKELSITEMEIE